MALNAAFYLLGMSFVVNFLFLSTGSMTISTPLGRLIFSVPFIYFLFKKTNVPVLDGTCKNKCSRAEIGLLICLGIALALFTKLYHYILCGHLSSALVKHSDDTVIELMAYAFGVLILAPVTEELFFRKWAVDYLEKHHVTPLYVLLITTVLFFFAHEDWTNLSISRFDMIPFACAQYYIYCKYRDIRYCMLVHFVDNLTANLFGLGLILLQ